MSFTTFDHREMTNLRFPIDVCVDAFGSRMSRLEQQLAAEEAQAVVATAWTPPALAASVRSAASSQPAAPGSGLEVRLRAAQQGKSRRGAGGVTALDTTQGTGLTNKAAGSPPSMAGAVQRHSRPGKENAPRLQGGKLSNMAVAQASNMAAVKAVDISPTSVLVIDETEAETAPLTAPPATPPFIVAGTPSGQHTPQVPPPSPSLGPPGHAHMCMFICMQAQTPAAASFPNSDVMHTESFTVKASGTCASVAFLNPSYYFRAGSDRDAVSVLAFLVCRTQPPVADTCLHSIFPRMRVCR